jgi:RNA polymerase sigma factor (TIGR02999 family)
MDEIWINRVFRRRREAMEEPDPQTAALLEKWASGDREALGAIMPKVYADLRKLARRYLRSPNGTLQPTALVNEVYLRLVGSSDISWPTREHFFAGAAQLMRRILVDHYRANYAQKRGGGRLAIPLDESAAVADVPPVDFIDLDRALNELAAGNPRGAQIVEQRFFMGLSIEETAEALGLSTATVKRDWEAASAWIYARLKEGGNPDERG